MIAPAATVASSPVGNPLRGTLIQKKNSRGGMTLEISDMGECEVMISLSIGSCVRACWLVRREGGVYTVALALHSDRNRSGSRDSAALIGRVFRGKLVGKHLQLQTRQRLYSCTELVGHRSGHKRRYIAGRLQS
jgi:hypothetical protein